MENEGVGSGPPKAGVRRAAAGQPAEKEPGEQRQHALIMSDLLGELAEKVRLAGVEGVRILTDEEFQRLQLDWYSTGWEEHARAVEGESVGVGEHPDTEGPQPRAGRVLCFPEQPSDGPPALPLPVVGAGDAGVRELMPHRLRGRSRKGRGEE
ncbi:hypothetical protein [Streptomyces sp. NPDC050504]|uniref:hypothetical protein n=1 Tax=Streptomyces sp. NPDC050504 TaxID=3365618 RepID=UPI003792A359